MLSFSIPQVISAHIKAAEFFSVKSSPDKDDYRVRSNPEFYQYLMDNDIALDSLEFGALSGTEGGLSLLPWAGYEGLITFYEGELYIISDDFESYLHIRAHSQTLNTIEEVQSLIYPIQEAFAKGYQHGLEDGAQQKAKEIRTALGV